MRAECGYEMSSCGKAEHANAMRIDMPFGGVGADDAEGALGILQCGGRFGVRTGIGTRYLSKTQVTPIEFSQSQTSVPSRSMARMW